MARAQRLLGLLCWLGACAEPGTQPPPPPAADVMPAVPAARAAVLEPDRFYPLLVHNAVSGCFNAQDKNENIAISGADLQALRAVVLASRSAARLDPTALGLTQQQLERKLPSLLRDLAEGRPGLEGMAADVRDRITLSYAIERAEWMLTSEDGGLDKASIELEIPGDPPLRVSSTHAVPWMLPWKVQLGDSSWETYATALPLLLSRRLPAYLPSHSLFDGTSYWEEGFWRDSSAWSALIEELEDNAARSAAAGIAGYSELQQRFRIDQAHLGHVNFQAQSLFLQLSATDRDPGQGRLLDAVWWFNPIHAGRPRDGWPRLRDAVATINSVVQRFPWLSEWRENSGARTIEGRLAGDRLYEEDSLDLYVTPAWRHAGYPGDPEIELLLRRDDLAVVTLYLSRSAAGALIVSANTTDLVRPRKPPSGPHWLDREQVLFHPRTPNYLTVDQRGRFQRRVIPKSFPPLQRALQH